jgi:hypothetical protein
MNKKIKEGLEMDMTTYKKVKGTIDPKTPVKITGDKPTPSSTLHEDEPEAVIQPQDKATIKYLSNVKDAKTGQVSAPFTIGDKRYQMVRGTTPSKEIVMAVFCHDDMDEEGNNIIHPVDYFEENIANPMKEQMGMVGQDIQVVPNERSTGDAEPEVDNFEGYKHYFVNRKTNEVRKFKSIKELVQCQKLEEEEYMGVREFKQHMNEKLFGSRKKKHDVIHEDDEDNVDIGKLNTDVKKLMDLIQSKLGGALKKINTPIEQGSVIKAFANMVGVPQEKISTIVSTIKDISNIEPTQQVTETKKLTKKQLEESLRTPKVIKTIKVKDIK